MDTLRDAENRARVFAAARFAARHCTRWRELLSEWIEADEAGRAGQLPIVERDDLFGATHRSPRALLVDGRTESLSYLLLSSGSSGAARRAWTAVSGASRTADAERLADALASLWGLERGEQHSLLIINALPPGPPLDVCGALVVHTGPEPELISELLASWAPEFATTLLAGEPWAVKLALERAASKGVELGRLDLRVAVGGELLPEPLRDYLAGLLQADLERAGARILSSLGCSEVGLQLAWETPATVALRRALVGDRAARASICGAELDSVPCIMTWDPSSMFVEFVDGRLVLTCLDLARAVPLIRYRLPDRGGFIVDRQGAAALLAARRPELSLPEHLLFICGREQPRLASMADAISQCADLLPHLLGGHFLDTRDDTLIVQLAGDELPAGVVAQLHARLERELRTCMGPAAPARLELRARSAFPHPSNPFTSKFQRSRS